jgi:hypothetical protein
VDQSRSAAESQGILRADLELLCEQHLLLGPIHSIKLHQHLQGSGDDPDEDYECTRSDLGDRGTMSAVLATAMTFAVAARSETRCETGWNKKRVRMPAFHGLCRRRHPR